MEKATYSRASLAWRDAERDRHACRVCGELVKISPLYFYRKYIPETCSRRCANQRSRKPKVMLTCKICGQQWEDYPSKAKIRVTCSRACYRLLQRQWYAKNGNPNWRGGLSYIRRVIHNSPLYDQFRSDVLNRAGFQCQSCGVQAAQRRRTNELDVHHVISFDELLSRIFDPDNAIALCPDCHTARHQE